MKTLNTSLITPYTNFTVSNINNGSLVGSYSCTNNVSIDNNSLIDDLRRKIIFKNDMIVNSLISNKELLNCLTDTLELISQNGLLFHADLDVITDDIEQEPKLLLVYYPFKISKNTNVSIQKELLDTPVNRVYRELIRNLYRYSISIRKSVVIDEQLI